MTWRDTERALIEFFRCCGAEITWSIGDSYIVIKNQDGEEITISLRDLAHELTETCVT
jgi:hypothetical protein